MDVKLNYLRPQLGTHRQTCTDEKLKMTLVVAFSHDILTELDPTVSFSSSHILAEIEEQCNNADAFLADERLKEMHPDSERTRSLQIKQFFHELIMYNIKCEEFLVSYQDKHWFSS